ncbi:hypothetical protein Sulac_0533 [Sulfobacillus acidophilus DSM 10332]|uniref:Uncharacterized protein n=1 Tax=Sulfobacillus acidophilus (strain ATCC 700253 / DSM 10332 / NAL) TaxID=679936 RepID=G8TZA5_SULAD|nr:hypothetical protein Sulac_0533 [Sulfobacillus acidophilus DSM 10332]
MGHMAQWMRKIYAPGLKFHIVSDSTFYGLPFGVTAVESQEYIRSLQANVERSGTR